MVWDFLLPNSLWNLHYYYDHGYSGPKIDSVDYYDNFGSGEIVVGIKTYQWGWEYCFPKTIDLTYSALPSHYSTTKNSFNTEPKNSNHLWKYYQNRHASNTANFQYLRLSPCEGDKILNFMKFAHVSTPDAKDSHAFKNITYLFKANELPFKNKAEFDLKYQKISDLYWSDVESTKHSFIGLRYINVHKKYMQELAMQWSPVKNFNYFQVNSVFNPSLYDSKYWEANYKQYCMSCQRFSNTMFRIHSNHSAFPYCGSHGLWLVLNTYYKFYLKHFFYMNKITNDKAFNVITHTANSSPTTELAVYSRNIEAESEISDTHNISPNTELRLNESHVKHHIGLKMENVFTIAHIFLQNSDTHDISPIKESMSIRDDNSVESPSIVGFTFDEKHIKRESEGSDLDNTSIVTPRRVNENHIKSETGVDKNAFWRTCFKLIKDVGDQIKNIEYDYERQLPLGSYNGCQPQTKSADEAITDLLVTRNYRYKIKNHIDYLETLKSNTLSTHDTSIYNDMIVKLNNSDVSLHSAQTKGYNDMYSAQAHEAFEDNYWRLVDKSLQQCVDRGLDINEYRVQRKVQKAVDAATHHLLRTHTRENKLK